MKRKRQRLRFLCWVIVDKKNADLSIHLDLVGYVRGLRLVSTSSARSLTSACFVRRRIWSITLPHCRC
jgi:hypothetical protein